jgi:hypothetical protein
VADARILQGVRAIAWWRMAPNGMYFVDGSTTVDQVASDIMLVENFR